MQEIKPMSAAKSKRLAAAGFRETTIGEFLDLTPEEEEVIKIKVELCHLLARSRMDKNLTKADVDALLDVSETEVKQTENGRQFVGMEATLLALLAAGATRRDIGRAIAGSL